MKRRTTDRQRRRVIKTALVSAAALPFVPFAARAAEEKLSESDPAAVALGYKTDASEVDTGKFPRRAGAEGAKQFCHNCQLFTGEDEWGTCSIFPGKLVNRNGWCNAWTPKAG